MRVSRGSALVPASSNHICSRQGPAVPAAPCPTKVLVNDATPIDVLQMAVPATAHEPDRRRLSTLAISSARPRQCSGSLMKDDDKCSVPMLDGRAYLQRVPIIVVHSPNV